MNNDTEAALRALMDLVSAMADVLEAPTATQRAKAAGRMAAERREVEEWRKSVRPHYPMEELLAQSRPQQATGRGRFGAVVSDGQEAKAAVEATVRRWEAYAESRRELGRLSLNAYEALEADDSRVTDGHQCCGGKPDCGCRSVGG